MTKNTLKTHKSKKFWTILLWSLGGLALILGSVLGITCSKLSKNALSLETKANANNTAMALNFITQSEIDCNAYDSSNNQTTYKVKDYVYFPSYDDVNTNYGLNQYSRVCAPTDWAIANYGYVWNTSKDSGYIPMGTMRQSGSC